MTDNVYILDKETLVDIFSVWKDTWLLLPEDDYPDDDEDVSPEEQANYFIETLEALRKGD